MKQLVKPKALQKGDIVATVSLSWGGAGQFPDYYNRAKKQFETTFGVKVLEMPYTLSNPQVLSEHPEYRLDDLMQAFLDPNIKAILTTIGGDDTIRLLSLMTDKHFQIIQAHPKIFMGMSDTTTNHFMCYKAGISSFYSPSLMFGYAEPGGMPDLIVQNTQKTLFSTQPVGRLSAASEYIIESFDWKTAGMTTRQRTPAPGWKYIQGTIPVQGRLLGGCMEVLSMINGTSLWPTLSEWDESILFLETSEERQPPSQLKYFLRNLGAQGILKRIKGILFARPGGEFSKNQTIERENWLAQYQEFDDVLLQVAHEYGRSDLCIVSHMDFGHTVPQLILPMGMMTEIDPVQKSVTFLESAVK